MHKKHHKRTYNLHKIGWVFGIVAILLMVGCQSDSIENRPTTVYNVTAVGNNTGIVELFQLVNHNIMFGFLGIELLLALFVIMFMSFLTSTGGDGIKSFAAASYITFIMNIFFLSLNVVPPWTIFATIIMSAIATVMIKT